MTHQSFQDKVRTRKITREVFVNDNGAIDLASIMVGIIVIGLIGAIIAATIFAVIPWAQDNAAKQQLDSVKAAEDAYRGLAEDSGISKYGNNTELADPTFGTKKHPSLLNIDETKVRILTTPAPNPTYTAVVVSDSGKTFTMTNGGQIKEVKDDDGSSVPPGNVDNVSLSATAYNSISTSMSSQPNDTGKVLFAYSQPISDGAYQSLKTGFGKKQFASVDGITLPDSVSAGNSNYYGGGDLYLVRPNTVIVSDSSGKELAKYAGNQGTVLLYGTVGTIALAQIETAVPTAYQSAVENVSSYSVTFIYNEISVTVKTTPASANPGQEEIPTTPGPTGNGSDLASQTFQATTVDYIPGRDDGQGYDTQEAYNNALITRDTAYWGVRITVNNPNPQSLPDLSDVPFIKNSDGTYTAEMQDGRWYKEPQFRFANGNSATTAGNADMASVGMDIKDFYGRMILTADADMKITSIKTDYIGIRIPVNSTLEEAKAAFAGSTIEYYPYGTKPNDSYTQVSTTKTIKFTLK